MCRNILLFPNGNREVSGNSISLYLNVADHESAPPGWSRTAKFTLSVIDQKEPERSATKGSLFPLLHRRIHNKRA